MCYNCEVKWMLNCTTKQNYLKSKIDLHTYVFLSTFPKFHIFIFHRLRIAQEIQREQEEIEVKLKELEARGVLIEKALRGEGPNMEE